MGDQAPTCVILSAAKNLVLYPGVSLFSRDSLPCGKGAIWVLEDEILRYAQNDRGELGGCCSTGPFSGTAPNHCNLFVINYAL